MTAERDITFEALLLLGKVLAVVIKVFGGQSEVDQLKLVQLMIFFVIAKITDADVVWFEVIVDVANLM